MWADELKLAIAEAAEHLSLYQLTIEPETPFFGLHAAGKLKTPDEAIARALYDVTQEVCAQHGLPSYEISNHARSGAECRHNLVYWRGEEYAGIGPGAHGRLDLDGARHAIATEKRPETWLMRVEALGHGVITDDRLNSEERADEFLLMGLRLAEGIDQALRSPIRPRPRSAAHRGAAGRKAPSSSTPADDCASPRPDFRCLTPWWPISLPEFGSTRQRFSANPRPAGRRPMPPASPQGRARCCRRPGIETGHRCPRKPDELVSTSAEKRWPPWVLASAATRATAS